jgi:hypothetical protein
MSRPGSPKRESSERQREGSPVSAQNRMNGECFGCGVKVAR